MSHPALRPMAAMFLAFGIANVGTATPAGNADPSLAELSPPAAAPAVPPAEPAAEPMCGAYDELRSLLGERFDEQPASSGLADDGTVVQVFAAPADGTWTLVSVDPSGTACVLATGQAWQQDDRPRQDQPA